MMTSIWKDGQFMADLSTILYYFGNMLLLSSFGLLLCLKAMRKKFMNVFYFGLAICINGGYYVINTIFSVFDINFFTFGLSEILVVTSFLPEIIFIKKTFYSNKNHPTIIFITIVYAVMGTISCLSGFLNDIDAGNPVYKTMRYTLDDLGIFPLILLWNVVLGLRVYHGAAKDADKNVRRRFRFFVYGQVFVIVSSVIDFMTAILVIGSYELYAPISLFCAVFYGISMYMTWFPRTRLADNGHGSYYTVSGDQQQITNMHVIEHFGKLLSSIIGKTPSACSGLLLLSIESTLGESAITKMTIKDLEHVFEGTLRERLQMLGISEPASVILKLKQELASNIPVFTMTMF